MARFMVKASEFKNVCKAVNDRKLAELKKEIIEILKKQDEKDVKKAIDYFNSQEGHYTHLEKSLISGKWIRKAGYGVGTVRIWKGKKYKKIAPGKWARVFDKEGRGTNIAIGKLIAKVQKIDNIEDLMAFVMQNKQRFVDENGIDLPVLDKLRAAVDARNGNVGSKEQKYKDDNELFIKEKIQQFTEIMKDEKPSLDRLKMMKQKQEAALKAAKEEEPSDGSKGRIKIAEEKLKIINQEIDEINKKNKETSKPAEKNSLSDKDKKMMKDFDLSESDYLYLKNKVFDELNPNKDGIKTGVSIQGLTGELYEKDNKFKKLVDKIEAQRPGSSRFYGDFMYQLKKNEDITETEKEPAEKKTDDSKAYEGKLATQKQVDEATAISNKYEVSRNEMLKKPITTIQKYANSTVEDFEGGIDKFIEYMAEGRSEGVSMDEVGKEFAKLINHNVARKIWDDYKSGALVPDEKGILKPKEESEAEKTQNRSEAMKGNQNARKYGLTDEQIEYYDIQEVVEDINGYGIVKNSEGKYSYIDDGRVRDRPDDFETSIEKVKERINDTYETKKNIQAAKDYDFKNARLGSDIEYTKRNDGKHLYYKKSPDGSKAISVIVEVSDMREPLNMTYEVSDIKSGESWQYETAYGNKEGLEWAVERPEQMEKELKKFFKRDPEKEWNKQNTTDSITNFESEGKAVSYDELKPIATNKSVGENEVQMPYSKDIAAEIEALKKCAYELPDISREFMRHVYYVDGNLVATDGRRMKVVKVGELDGISDGSYVDITTNKSGINIKKIEVEGNFPNYKKVIPDNLNQTATLDTKLVKEKIKEMRKDGAIDKKGINLVQLEFRDGKVFIDDTPVGNAKDIALKFSKNWGEATDDTNFVNFNADYLENALTGKTAVLQMGDRADKAMAINTGSTSNIVMPMNGDSEKRDYSGNRMARDAENEAKEKKKADNRKYNESKIKEYTPKNVNINIDDMKNRMKEMSDEELKRNYDMLTFNLDKVMDKKMFTTGSAKVDSKLGLDLAHAVAYKAIVEKYPEVKDIVSSELESRGISVKKSLFDDFIVDMFVEEDEEEEPEEENESLFNDYSAEQPELFNSTEMMVSEAFNRCNCL